MKILFLLRHPVDVMICNRLKNGLEASGHETSYLVIEKENIIQKMLEYHEIKYHYAGHFVKGLHKKFINMFKLDSSLYKLIKKLSPDLSFSPVYPSLGQASVFFDYPNIGLADTDTANLNNMITFPFYDVILTPAFFKKNLFDSRLMRFNGYKELIYAHPNYFKPDKSVLDDLGLSKQDNIIILRFSAQDSTHDSGPSAVDKFREFYRKEIKKLEEHGRVFISGTEKTLGKKFEKYELSLHPARYIDLLGQSALYMGEGSTTAGEAGVMGVPWIFLLDSYRGQLNEQERKYGLGFNISDHDAAFRKANELMSDKNTGKEWKRKSKHLLKEKIDVGKFLVWFIDKYPESREIMGSDPEYQERFK